MAIRDEGLWGNLGSAFGEGVSNATDVLIQHMQQQKQARQQEQLMQALQGKGYAPQDLALLTPQQQSSLFASAVKDQPAQLAKQQQVMTGAQRAMDNLSELKDLVGQRSWFDNWKSKGNQSASTQQARAIMKSLQKNPYIKDANIILPDIEIGPDALIPILEEAQKAVSSKYGFGPQQEQKQQQLAEEQQLPEKLVQPRSLQEGGVADSASKSLGEQISPVVSQAFNQLGVLKDPARIVGRGALEYGLARNPVTVASDAFSALENARDGMLPSEEEVDEIAKYMNPSSARQLKELYADEKRSLKLSNYLPTSDKMRSLVGNILGKENIEAKTPLEKDIVNIAQKMGSMKLFGGTSLPRAAFGATAGTVGRKGAESLGLGKAGQIAAELGFTMMADPLFSGLKNQMNKAAGAVYDKLPQELQGKFTSTKGLYDTLKEVEGELALATDASSRSLSKQLEELTQEAQLGKLDLMRLREHVKGMNKYYYGKGGGKETLDRGSRYLFNKVRDKLEDTLATGMKQNKLGQLYNEYTKAKDITRGMHEADFAVKNIYDAFKKGQFKSSTWRTLAAGGAEPAIGGALGLAAIGNIPGAVLGATAGIGANTLRNAYKFLSTPGAMKEFRQAALGAFTNSVPVMMQGMYGLEQLALENENKKRR